MAAVKTSTLTIRIEPTLKEAVRTAASQERRSIANMVEVMIRDHCVRLGISIATEVPPAEPGMAKSSRDKRLRPITKSVRTLPAKKNRSPTVARKT